jgi:hypothetical protein
VKHAVESGTTVLLPRDSLVHVLDQSAAAAYTGIMGGNFGVTQKCQLEFSDSRMCSAEEVLMTTSIPSGLSGVAWIHYPQQEVFSVSGIAAYIQGVSQNCLGWRHDSFSFHGWAVASDGTLADPHVTSCDTPTQLACCALVP